MKSSTAPVLTPRILKALNVAAVAHDGHRRKGTDIPYVSHLYGVMYVASCQTLPEEIREDVLIACLLHDTLEDVPERYSVESMEKDFGPQVTQFVRSVTKDESIQNWHQRSESYLEHLRSAPMGAVVVSACDKLHNLSSILADYDTLGADLWSRFNSGCEAQRWWYHSIYDVVAERFPELELLGEYGEKLRRLDAAVEESVV